MRIATFGTMSAQMDVFAVLDAAKIIWLYVCAPLLALTALVFTVRLKLPQFRRLGAGYKALRSKPEDGDGVAPGLVVALSAAGNLGAAAVVGAGIAVAVGGPGVLPYLWVFCFLLAPIRYAETLFAGTDAPGGGDADKSGSVPRRLMRMGGKWKSLGALAALATLTTAFVFGGVVQAQAMDATASALFPGSATTLILATAGAGSLMAVGAKKTASLVAMLGLFGLVTLLAVALWAVGSNPASAFDALISAFGAAIEGPSRFEAFGGAFAGEVAFAAVLNVLPALSSTTGADGAIQNQSAGGVRAQAAASLYGPLGFAVIASLLCMGLIGTGAYGTRVDTTVHLPDGHVFGITANDRNQRVEEARLFSGYIRTRAGTPRNPALTFGNGSGMIEDPVVLYNGRAADLALHVEKGKVFRILRNTSGTTLNEVANGNLWRVEIQGQMAPSGGPLVLSAANIAGGDLAGKLVLMALLALGLAAFALWGFAASRSLPADVPAAARAVVCLLPFAGAAFAVLAAPLGLWALALLITGITVSIQTVILLLRNEEIASLDR